MDNQENMSSVFFILNIAVYWAGKFVAWFINLISRRKLVIPKYLGLAFVFFLTMLLYILTEYALAKYKPPISPQNAYDLGRIHGYFTAQAVVPGFLVFLVVLLFSGFAKFFKKS